MQRFVNISNHPSDRWSEKQRQAALALLGGKGQIIDIPFPPVDPSWDSEGVWKRAAELIDKTLSPDLFDPGAGTIFHVQGEAGMTYALVGLLQKKGGIVVHSTTERRVVEHILPDGRTEKASIFEFCQFRGY